MHSLSLKIAITLATLIVLAVSCADPNCISCINDPTYCKNCKPGFRAAIGKCEPCDDPNCSNCN